MRALIVGAGLGGLTLAHGLIRSGLDVEILERAAAPTAQPASYGIHLNADGLRALHACLPTANWERLAAAAVAAPERVRFWNPRLDMLAELSTAAPDALNDPIAARRSIGRRDLHAALLHGLDAADGRAGVVRWGTRFAGYENAPDGSLTVRCTDGGQTTADLLIGADGSNSAVRTQRLPGLGRLDLGIDVVAGRTALTPELADRLPAALVDGAVNNVVPAGPGWLFTSTWPSDPATRAPASVVWAWAAARSFYPADVDILTATQLRAAVSRAVDHWSPALRGLIDRTDPATIAPVRLRTMPHLDPWEPGTVTLLGDAIHNMTPMAGIGANTALRDADQLRRALVADGPEDLATRVGSYETAMRAYANEALALSTRNARNAASTRRLPRIAFRTVLRIAEIFPPIKQKVFGSQSIVKAPTR